MDPVGTRTPSRMQSAGLERFILCSHRAALVTRARGLARRDANTVGFLNCINAWSASVIKKNLDFSFGVSHCFMAPSRRTGFRPRFDSDNWRPLGDFVGRSPLQVREVLTTMLDSHNVVIISCGTRLLMPRLVRIQDLYRN